MKIKRKILPAPKKGSVPQWKIRKAVIAVSGDLTDWDDWKKQGWRVRKL